MGVDYNGAYGCGIQICPHQVGEEGTYNEYNDLHELLDEALKDAEYGYQYFGNRYSGDDMEFWVELDDPFGEGPFKLYDRIHKLYKFLDDKGIEYIGKFNVFGGLDIY